MEDFKNYRKIEPLLIDPKKLDYKAIEKFEPDIRMVNPNDLSVDDKYQRNVSRKSALLIKKIIREWSWQAFKPPICTEYSNGLFVLDGQHTAIAAATHPYVDLIPVFIVTTFDSKDRAESFVRHNVDRTKVSDIQLFKSRLEMGEDVATSINMALQRSGAHLTNVSIESSSNVGDIACLKTLEVILNQHGLQALRKVLDVCIAAKLAPIQAHYVIAISNLMYDTKYRDKYDPEGLSLVIREYPYPQLAGDIEYKSRSERIRRKDIATVLIKEAYNKMFKP